MSLSEQQTTRRQAAVQLTGDQFREMGHQLVERIAVLLETMGDRPVTPAPEPSDIKRFLGAPRTLPMEGSDPKQLLEQAASVLIENSLYNGHPSFWGYVTAGSAPMGILADFLAAAVNPNCGGWTLSPVGSEIETQSVQWIAELIGYPSGCGGLLVSGGNMANFVGFLAARVAKTDWDVREKGLTSPNARKLIAYCSVETHTWMQKAADLFGIGTDSIRWIPTDKKLRMDTNALRTQIESDLSFGLKPFFVAGTAGTVSTGAVDPLYEIAAICRKHDLWFHVDGAYGGFAAKANGVPTDLKGLSEADSVAVDPHKWLYMPLEAGCALVRDREAMIKAFSYHPPYYHFDPERMNYVDFGMQNSRGFRALKIWLTLQQVGRAGYLKMIEDDIRLSEEMFKAVQQKSELEPFTQGLSIATFRYVPTDLKAKVGEPETLEYLNKLNEEVMLAIEKSGQAFVSPARLQGVFVLRACIVNFRTSSEDVQAFPDLVCRLGKEVDARIRPKN